MKPLIYGYLQITDDLNDHSGVVDAHDPGQWAGMDIGRRRAVLDALMIVTVLPVPRGAPPRFDPSTIKIHCR